MEQRVARAEGRRSQDETEALNRRIQELEAALQVGVSRSHMHGWNVATAGCSFPRSACWELRCKLQHGMPVHLAAQWRCALLSPCCRQRLQSTACWGRR